MSHINYYHVLPDNFPYNGNGGTSGTATGILPNTTIPYAPWTPPYKWPDPFVYPPTTITTTSGPIGKRGRTVYTGGTFDVFHVGHVKFLEQCANIAGDDGEVIVSLNTDEFIMEYKGVPPTYSYADRERILKSCIYVDKVIPNSGGADSKPAILSVEPDFIVIGSDWAKRDYYAQMGFTQDWLYDNGISLLYVPYTEGVSTTAVKASIRGQLNG